MSDKSSLAQRVERNRTRINEIKTAKGCEQCGYKGHPAALHCDHVDESTKHRSVSELVSAGRSWEMILGEIEKCQILCANCHCIRTFERRMMKKTGKRRASKAVFKPGLIGFAPNPLVPVENVLVKSRVVTFQRMAILAAKATGHAVKRFIKYRRTGIKVCQKWTGPSASINLLNDMGPKPGPGYQLRRLDCSKPYSKDNCRWMSPPEWRESMSKVLNIDGTDYPLCAVRYRFDVSKRTFQSRVALGWEPALAASAPVRKYRRSNAA